MGICWYCHWGWPKPIADIYDAAIDQMEGDESLMLYGPAHVVWADENWGSAQFCLDHFEERRHDDYSDADHEIVRESLRKLIALPDNVIFAEPEDYDGEHPESYPPPIGMEMVLR
jgi:hypothetical protein